jgi:hypothetical protein
MAETARIPLGIRAMDRITGFSGVATGRATYLTGCTQILLAPQIDPSGAFREPHWFDEQRLEVDYDSMPLTLDNGATPGPDKPAPKL